MSESIQDREFYNEFWKELKPFGSYKIHRVLWLIRSLLQYRKEIPLQKLLDFGCGDGRCVAIWNEIIPAMGFDLSPRAMQVARSRYPHIVFHSGDAIDSQLERNSFGIIVSSEVIEHIRDQGKYINECANLLAPGGILLLTTPNRFYFDRRLGGNYSAQPVENILTRQQLAKLLSIDFYVLSFESVTLARGDFGIYRLLSNRYLLGLVNLLGLKSIFSVLMEKKCCGVTLCVAARRK